jgi:hypothetical protein
MAIGDPYGTMQLPADSPIEAAQTVGRGLGLEKATDPFMKAAARATVPSELKEAIPEPKWSELAGGGLQIGSMFIPYGKLAKLGIKYGSKILPETIAKITAMMGTGGLGGYTYEAGEKIQRGEAPTPGITTLAGATTGPALAATAKVASFGGKMTKALFGKAPPNKVRQLGEKYGIRTTLGEEIDNPIIKKAETWLEDVPILGLKGFRKKQQAEAAQASKDFISKYIAGGDEGIDVLETNREYVSELYDTFKGMLKNVTRGVRPKRTQKAANELLERYPKIFKEFEDVKREGILRAVAKKTKTQKGVIQPKPDIITGVKPGVEFERPAEFDFEEIWELRKGLGEMIGQAKKKLVAGTVDRTQLGKISKLYKAVNDDIDNWVKVIKKPEIKEALTTANDAYKQFVVRYDILDDIMAKVTGETGAGEMFSPKKLSTALKNIAWKQKKMQDFTPSQIKEMTGIANVMQIIKRAGQFAENPPTGNRWGALGITALKGLKVVPYAAVGRFMSGTTLGKDLALAAMKAEPTSAAMGKILSAIYSQAPKMAALAGD